MRIKSTSKTLNRTSNSEIFAVKYHATTVFELNKKTGVVTLRTDNFETMNTARAMDIAFEEAGIEAHVQHCDNKKEQGLFLTLNGTRQLIKNGMEIKALSKLEVTLK